MMPPGASSSPLRIAIVGSGPAGFYAAEHLFKQAELDVQIDMLDRLPTPFGLVRGGVAPDHQKIKNVTRIFDRIARRDSFCFYGNVEIGRDLSIDDLRRHYHAVVVATGAQTDRSMGIPGEALRGSHSATEFVAWYNGHLDFRHHTFDLSAERVVIVGVGNVAVDVARILCRTTDELAETDIAPYALDALRSSNIREVYMLGRRGPAQAAFTNPEVRELGALSDTDVIIRKDDLDLDEATRRSLKDNPDRETAKKLEILRDLSQRPAEGRRRRLHIRFLTSPTEFLDDGEGAVGAVRLVRNRIEEYDGRIRAIPTDETELIDAQLVFRSIGYRGVPLPGLPFDERAGTIPNDGGRIVDLATREPIRGMYVAGWIKRGPSGVIGTNKPCSVETVELLLEDMRAGRLLDPEAPGRGAVCGLIEQRRPDHFTYDDWLCIDEHEIALGEACGRPRIKLTSLDEMLQVLRDAPAAPPDA